MKMETKTYTQMLDEFYEDVNDLANNIKLGMDREILDRKYENVLKIAEEIRTEEDRLIARRIERNKRNRNE